MHICFDPKKLKLTFILVYICNYVEAMEGFNNTVPMCPVDQHCSQWAEKNMSYCLCSTKDVISLTLGVISVLSWGVAEIPQLITNYKEKSVEGLSLMFIMAWILG